MTEVRFGIIFPNMEPKVKNTLFAATLKLLRPLVKILLRNGIPFKAFADLAKWVYVDVAMSEFEIKGKKQTDSRISIITGLSRKEVRRIKQLERFSDKESISRYNRAARVVAGWVRDNQFKDNGGRPKDLSFDQGEASFSKLVKRYSGDVPPRAILDELMDVSAIKILKTGDIRLLTQAYLPAGDAQTMLGILGTDVAHLIDTIDHNIFNPQKDRRFQRKVAYDNVPMDAAEEFRKLSADKAQQLLIELDRWLAAHDRDATPSVKGFGRKNVGLGIFYIEEDFADEISESKDNGGSS